VHELKEDKKYLADIDGKLCVEMAKFFSVLLPILISLDHSHHIRLKCKTEANLRTPSSTILLAETLHLIFPSTVYRAIAVSTKRSILKYFESTRFIYNLTGVFLEGIIRFVENILHSKGILKLSGYGTVDCDDGDWISDPSIRREVKLTLSSEFSEVIMMLAKLKMAQHSPPSITL
jgi:hypothetical protein